MKHRHETEVKLEVKDVKGLRRRLTEQGFRVIKARHFESNILFDFPDLRLRKLRCLVRLRYMGDQALLTYKGTPLQSRDYKIRPEYESFVDDGHRVHEILLHLGLQEMFSYEKYRTIYAPRGKRDALDGPHLVYDETPVGSYIELEGPQRWIDEVARQLGYSRKDYIKESYAALYRKKCQEEGKTAGNMLFTKRES
jgi:adenylate cyclase class 2